MTSSDPELPTQRADLTGNPEALRAEVAEAEERAEAARARAQELRRQLQAGEVTETPSPAPEAAARPSVPVRTVGVVLAALLTAGLLGFTGSMLWQHREHTETQQRAAEYAAAARQGVINLMSIDFNSAKDSVQRVLDSSTGKFRDNFLETSEEFVKAVQAEKVTTTATVNDAAVESMTGDTAVVLVSATSIRQGPQAPKDQQQPRVWRVVVTMQLDDGQPKLSGVEFV